MFFYWCPHCPQKLHAEREHVGYRARCPRCAKTHTVPDPDDPFLVGADDPHGSRTQSGRRSAVMAGPPASDPFAPFKPLPSSEPRSNVFRRCPGCRAVLQVDNEWAGILCRYCGAEIPSASDHRC
jgi:DNA-directed RNA polymerase subunit RPC12/RpoP